MISHQLHPTHLVHVALLFQHYHTPDCATAARPYALAERLSREFAVTLITTDAYRKRRITRHFPWVPEGVRLVELSVPYQNAMSTPRRLGSYLSYAAGSAWRGSSIPSPDLIFGSSTPLTVGISAAVLARRWDVPWIFEVRDLWPAFPIQMGAIPFYPLQRQLRRVERWLYDDATRIITASPEMSRHVRAATNCHVYTVPYGTDFKLLAGAASLTDELVRQHALKGKRLVCYAGALGRANAIPTLLASAHALQHRSDIIFAIAGAGFHNPTVRHAASRSTNIRLLPPLPLVQALALFRLADISLVTFRDLPVLTTSAPSKFFDSLAAGTPPIVMRGGWVHKLVQRHGCGWAVPPEDPVALARTIERSLASKTDLETRSIRAARIGRRIFDRSTQLDRIARLVRQTICQYKF